MNLQYDIGDICLNEMEIKHFCSVIVCLNYQY